MQQLRAEIANKEDEMVAQEHLMDKLEEQHAARMALEKTVKDKESELKSLEDQCEVLKEESRNFEKIRRQLIVEQEDLRELEERWKKSEDQIKVFCFLFNIKHLIFLTAFNGVYQTDQKTYMAIQSKSFLTKFKQHVRNLERSLNFYF